MTWRCLPTKANPSQKLPQINYYQLGTFARRQSWNSSYRNKKKRAGKESDRGDTITTGYKDFSGGRAVTTELNFYII